MYLVSNKYLSFEAYIICMAASNLSYFMNKYYPKTEKLLFISLSKINCNLTENSFNKSNIEIDLRINFGY